MPKKKAKAFSRQTRGAGASRSSLAPKSALETHAQKFQKTKKGRNRSKLKAEEASVEGAEKHFQMRTRKFIENEPPMQLARFAVAKIAKLHREARTDAERKALECDLETLHNLAMIELKTIKGKSPCVQYLTLRKDALLRIGILANRGAKAPDEEFRREAVDDLASIFDGVVEALARIAVECRDIQAVRYLAWRADLADHRLPKGSTKSLEDTIEGLGSEYAEAWFGSRDSRAWMGKHAPRKMLGVWAEELWTRYVQFCMDVQCDDSNRQMNFPDVPTAQQRWTAFLRGFALPPDCVTYSENILNLDGEGFLDKIAKPALERLGTGDAFYTQQWDALVGVKYPSKAGGPDWSKIKSQMRMSLKAWAGKPKPKPPETAADDPALATVK